MHHVLVVIVNRAQYIGLSRMHQIEILTLSSRSLMDYGECIRILHFYNMFPCHTSHGHPY